MCALAYRQCACACGLAADANKQPLFFTKENTSNGDIATVDVFFPMDPQWVLLSPRWPRRRWCPFLLRGQLALEISQRAPRSGHLPHRARHR
jgi:hypothetical protein